MTEQDKNLRKRTKQSGDSKLTDKEFKVMIIKMLNKLERRMNEHSENFNKELENIKNQTELKNTVTEIKNTLEGINSRSDDTEKGSAI